MHQDSKEEQRLGDLSVDGRINVECTHTSQAPVVGFCKNGIYETHRSLRYIC